jgi:signal transduction histidine kinase
LRARREGLQFEIITNLFVIVLTGLTIVAVVMGALAAQTVDRAALAQLRMGARQLERAMAWGSPRLEDLSALVRTLPPRTLGGRWTVVDERGRDLAGGPGMMQPVAELLELSRMARRTGEALQGGGFPLQDRVLAVDVVTPGGEAGTLVGRVSKQELTRRLLPILRSGAWLLVIAASVFVAFGSYLLHRRIVRPLQRLSLATRQVAAGNLSVSTEISGSDELAELARNFNHMAESLAREHEALRRAHRSLSQSERLAGVGRLAAGVAHEVGNPVAAILGYADLLLRETELSSRGREASERVRDEALRVRTLVRELLDLSRSDTINLQPLSSSGVLERVAERMRPQKLLAGVELVIEIEPDLPAVRTDARRVEQILVNLIENAAFAVRGQALRRIDLRADRAQAQLRPARRRDDQVEPSFVSMRVPDAVALAVIDNGPGIDPEDMPQLFDPFFTTKDPGEGTGLGLWNCYRIAELLGGRLEAESEPGRTCFSLVLPATDTRAGDVQPPRSDHR